MLLCMGGYDMNVSYRNNFKEGVYIMQKMTDSTIIESSDNSMEAETNIEDIKSSLKVLIDDLDSINNALERERQNIIGVEKSLTYIIENNPKQAIQEVPVNGEIYRGGNIGANIIFSIIIIIIAYIFYYKFVKETSNAGEGYSNLDPDSLFIIFKSKYNAKDSENDGEQGKKKQSNSSLFKWLCDDVIVFSVMVLIVVYVLYVIVCVLSKSTSLEILAPGFSFLVLLFLAVHLNKISSYFRKEDKIKADKAIDAIKESYGIEEWTKESIDAILQGSANIGEQPYSGIRSLFKSGGISKMFILLSSVIAYIFGGIQAELVKLIIGRIGDGSLLYDIFPFLFLVLFMYDFLFALYVYSERKTLLYRKVLEEKRLTLALKK